MSDLTENERGLALRAWQEADDSGHGGSAYYRAREWGLRVLEAYDRAEAERDALNRARLAALRAVASVLTVLGDDAPASLIDAHRFLATGRTDEDRAILAAPVPAAPPTKETP